MRPEALPTRVPWIIQDVFPDYHGVAWYWRQFLAPRNPNSSGRYLLRFWAVDYKADVWVNGVPVGGHEGGETPFLLDVTEAIKPAATNLVAVRVLNPAEERIDGIVLKETPHRNKTSAFTFGSDYNHGGIEDSVELLLAPAVRVEDVFVRADPKTGLMRVLTTVRNTLGAPAQGTVELTVSPAAGGHTLVVKRLTPLFQLGDTRIDETLQLDHPRRWELHDPFLYRVTLTVKTDAATGVDERSVRCGFRDFRFEQGCFRLNGRRVYLRSSVSGNMTPIGIHVALDPDWLRRDLIHSKTMGFNCIRFYGLATRSQLDFCDELGLLVYEESFASQFYENSPKMAERFDQSTGEMVRRDRNHPSVVIWGLLNETGDTPQFRHAVQALDLVRSLDDSRVVLLSSARFDLQLGIGSIANPGSRTWEFLLGAEQAGAPATKSSQHLGYFVPAYIQKMGDVHAYPWVPHTAKDIDFLRTVGQDTKPIFISEYGIGSAMDLQRLVRQYEQRGKGDSGEARFHRRALELFQRDWEQWKLAEVFGRPEDFFRRCQARMTSERWLGINALRANPAIAGYNLTGTADQGYSGEGLTTAFRELKPGVVDAMADGLAPLRWCLFAEPWNLYRGSKVKLEAVLANEDVLAPGEYPARLDLFSEDLRRVWSRTIQVRVPAPQTHPEPPLAFPVFSEEVVADWPPGRYRFVATFEKGAAAAGGEATFLVTDKAAMPRVEAEISLWTPDEDISRWLAAHQVKTKPFSASEPGRREAILATARVPAPGGKEAFRDLARRIGRGSTVVFLENSVFALNGSPHGAVPLAKKGQLAHLRNNVYHKEDWGRNHPIFDGLPTGLLDYAWYRNVIPNQAWTGQDPPAEAVAGAIDAVTGYASGLHIGVHRLGAGKSVLNTLRIREHLNQDPVADRLLLNLLRFAARDMDRPLAELPADFASQLKAMGYD